jgi:hypothetical protein
MSLKLARVTKLGKLPLERNTCDQSETKVNAMTPQGISRIGYKSIAEIQDVVKKFEACVFSPTEFNHRAHLTVAFWYLTQMPILEAESHMRAGLRRFLRHHLGGLQAYNETITLFWLRRVRGFIDAQGSNLPPIALANEMLDAFDDSKIIFRYYSKELLVCDAVRTRWIEPDLQRLDF